MHPALAVALGGAAGSLARGRESLSALILS